MSSTDAVIYATQDLIHALHNPAPASLLVKLVNDHTAALRTLLGIFSKPTPQGKISKGGTTWIAKAAPTHQGIEAKNNKTPDYTKPLRVPIV